MGSVVLYTSLIESGSAVFVTVRCNEPLNQSHRNGGYGPRRFEQHRDDFEDWQTFRCRLTNCRRLWCLLREACVSLTYSCGGLCLVSIVFL